MKSKIKISDEKALSIIHKPLLTEKSTNLNQFNQYTFVVDKKSNSFEIHFPKKFTFIMKILKIMPNWLYLKLIKKGMKLI